MRKCLHILSHMDSYCCIYIDKKRKRKFSNTTNKDKLKSDSSLAQRRITKIHYPVVQPLMREAIQCAMEPMQTYIKDLNHFISITFPSFLSYLFGEGGGRDETGGHRKTPL